ncbi:hypothetical protein PsorP6_004080 [Peronosclerospora sorghi]|uniref:Uncharacterized protein n=1 Tax=Peronosclerospora sorghi TaxID=230839 RepID=A0ACC0VSK1_9STRA|nr:hypothetical protein PsorP6_004080 [Peronosclerospora sorghi]
MYGYSMEAWSVWRLGTSSLEKDSKEGGTPVHILSCLRLRSVCVLRAFASALCYGGTSRSVRILREMAAEEVGITLAFVYYILADE